MNGVAIAVVARLSDSVRGAYARSPADVNDPPLRTGLRGSHPGSFEVAHAVRDGQRYDPTGVPVEEHYDLVVVGAGISGLAAAYFYRQRHPSARILVLDTNDDFGGHAKRNEFIVDGRRLIGYGGTQSIDSPKRRYRGVPARLLQELGVDITRFQSAFDRQFFERRGMTRGTFFKREAFGVDKLVRQPFGHWDDYVDRPAPIDVVRGFIEQFPLGEGAKSKLIELYTSKRDVLAGRSLAERQAILTKTSARDFLKTYWGADDEVLKVLQTRTNSLWAVGIDAISASSALELPGFQGLKATQGSEHADAEEPYIYHFPDGNASIARLLVRKLLPGVALGDSMEDIVTARVDYAALDLPSSTTRIRLRSTAVDVHNVADGVEAAYVTDGKLHRIAASHCVLACYYSMMPFMVPDLEAAQREAFAENVRAPLVYVTVAARSWQAWQNLGIAFIANPGGTFEASLDFPVSLGAYHYSGDPKQPVCMHLEYEPAQPNQGLSMRQQYRAGRARLYGMTFGDFEREIRDELARMLGPGGFVFDRDVAAITVNRWPHGYAYTPEPLNDDMDQMAKIAAVARQKIGRIVIANSDSGWDAYTDVAINQAHRAIAELGD